MDEQDFVSCQSFNLISIQQKITELLKRGLKLTLLFEVRVKLIFFFTFVEKFCRPLILRAGSNKLLSLKY